MSTNESLVATLREQIDRKHREAIHALETLSAYLTEGANGAPAVAPVARQEAPPVPRPLAAPAKLTRVDRVLDAISGGYKRIGEIAADLGLTEQKVRTVLYAQAVVPKVQKKKIGGKLAFRLKSSTHAEPEIAEKKSVASLVRDLLARNQDGLRAGDIRKSLTGELQKIGVSPASVGSALYNLSKQGDLLRDGGIYRLNMRGTVKS